MAREGCIADTELNFLLRSQSKQNRDSKMTLAKIYPDVCIVIP